MCLALGYLFVLKKYANVTTLQGKEKNVPCTESYVTSLQFSDKGCLSIVSYQVA